MVIPDRVAELIQGPAFMQIATRDNDLWPRHAEVVGGEVHADGETVTVFIAAATAQPTLDNLERNGRMALGVALATHEAYQLKGSYVSSRPANAGDRARQEQYRGALHAAALAVGFPDEIARPLTLGSAYTPGLAITFRVEEAFLQTPGPHAGTALA